MQNKSGGEGGGESVGYKIEVIVEMQKRKSGSGGCDSSRARVCVRFVDVYQK